MEKPKTTTEALEDCFSFHLVSFGNRMEKKRTIAKAVTPVHGVDAKLCTARRIIRKPNTNKLHTVEKEKLLPKEQICTIKC